jgi:hypothetical protein
VACVPGQQEGMKPTGQRGKEWYPELFNLQGKDAMEKQTLNHRKDRDLEQVKQGDTLGPKWHGIWLSW